MEDLLSVLEYQIACVVQAAYDFQNLLLGGLNVTQPHGAWEFDFVP
jgi:hypothetical protein